MAARAHTLRIIGGKWRGRRVAIETAPDLRPTPDRIRETLFNWLAPRIAGARCLDLFAGTGALGLEALSRGAAQVTFIESDKDCARALRRTLSDLNCGAIDVRHGDTLICAESLQPGYDVVFIDPPFTAQLHAPSLAAIKPLINATARVYLEYPAAHADAIAAALPPDWRQLRDKRAGRVGYCLACPT